MIDLEFHPFAEGIRPLTPVECGAFNRWALVDGDGNTVDVVGAVEANEIIRADTLAAAEDDVRQAEHIEGEAASLPHWA
jgi:hypothetical protein